MKRLIPAGAAVLALAAGGAGVAAAAQTGAQKAADRPAAIFQERLAARLGVSGDKLGEATVAAGRDTVERLQAGGRLSADRAARLQRRLQRGRATAFTRLGARPRRGAAIRRAALDAEAKALGMERPALVAELRKGTAPSALISSRGKDRATVAAAVRDAARAKLQPAIDRGRVDAAKADARAAKLADRLTGDKPLRVARRG